jgi:hypothetical protein
LAWFLKCFSLCSLYVFSKDFYAHLPKKTHLLYNVHNFQPISIHAVLPAQYTFPPTIGKYSLKIYHYWGFAEV